MGKLKQKRNRGFVLTPIGLEKLKAARLEIESQENFGERFTYEKLSELTCLDINTIKRVLATKESVDKRTLEKFLIAFKVKLDENNYTKPIQRQRRDWTEAVSVEHFFGRRKELKQIETLLCTDHCRVIALLGMGGIGKTTLSIKVAEEIGGKFDCVIWKSLLDAPPTKDIIIDLIEFISEGKETAANLPDRLGDQITRLIEYLRSINCLIFLDNAESLLDSGRRTGKYRPGCEGYGELLRRLGATDHSSSLILTSREKPKEIAALEGDKLAVRSLQLEGLKKSEGQEILKIKGLGGSESELNILSDRYAGNPLAMKVVATTIQDLFEGNISHFISQEQSVFGDIRDILDQQFERLSPIEKEIMYWLAIAREPISLSELQSDFVLPISSIKLLEALESLSRRSLIEKNSSKFTQQPVVMEYLTSNLIEIVCEEIATQQLHIFRDHALIKATAKDYIRENQIRLILQPVIDTLLLEFRSKQNIEACLRQILTTMQSTSPLEKWYTAGNILNLFCQLEIDLTGYDFSNLCVWQADLRRAELHQVNFQNSDLTNSVFAENFGGIWSVAFSPDGKYLAAGDTKGNILLRRVADGQPIRTFFGHNAWVVSLAFSPDGNTLASSSCDCTAKLWDVKTGQCLHSLDEHEQEVWSVAFRPDGNTLATGCDDKKVRLWNIFTGKCTKVFKGHQNEVLSVAFGLDGQELISGSQDSTIRFWNIETGKCNRILEGHDDGVRSICPSPDGTTLASSSIDRTIRLWNIESAECVEVLEGHSNVVLSVTFSAQGNLLASSGIDQQIRVWNAKTGECSKILQEHSNYITSIDFSPQSNVLATGSNDQSVKIWDIDNYKCLKTWKGYSNQPLTVVFNPTKEYLASGGHVNKIRLWNFKTGKVHRILHEHTNWVFSVAFSPNGQLLASGSADKTIKIWNINTGKAIKTLLGHEAVVRSIAFGFDDSVLASCSEDGTIKLWDVKAGKTTKTLREHKAEIWSISFSPDYKILASASFDQTVKLWDVETGQCIKTLSGHDSWVWSIAFSPDKTSIVSSSADQTIRFWNLDTGKCEIILRDNIGNTHLVAFSNDGQILASCNQDHTIRLRDAISGECIKILQGHTALINSIAFSPDNSTLVSSSEDETIKLWDLENAQCIKTLRSENPYEKMNIENIMGLTKPALETLKILGATN